MPNKNVIAIHNEIYPNRFVGYANRDIWGIKIRVEDFTEGWKNFDSPANENKYPAYGGAWLWLDEKPDMFSRLDDEGNNMLMVEFRSGGVTKTFNPEEVILIPKHTEIQIKAGGVIFTESQYRGHIADMKNEYESNWPLDMHINVALYNSVFAEPEYCMMQKTTGEGLAFNSSVLSYGGIHYMPKNYITLLKNTKPTQQN
jgi:hypothetical protein